MYQYQPIDLSYFDTAPIRLDDHLDVDFPVASIWPIFADNKAWEEFTSGIKEATWTSEPPVHPGSTRRVQLTGMAGHGVVDEVFFDWQPNQQFAFYMSEGTSKMLVAYGEFWSVEDLGDGRTRLRLRTAFQLKSKVIDWLAWLIKPLLSFGYSRDLKSVNKYLQKHLKGN